MFIREQVVDVFYLNYDTVGFVEQCEDEFFTEFLEILHGEHTIAFGSFTIGFLQREKLKLNVAIVTMLMF